MSVWIKIRSLQNALFDWQKKITFYFVKTLTNNNATVEFYPRFTYTLGRRQNVIPCKNVLLEAFLPSVLPPKLFPPGNCEIRNSIAEEHRTEL